MVAGETEDFRRVEKRPSGFCKARLRIVAEQGIRRLTDADRAAGDSGLAELFREHFGGGVVVDRKGHPHRRIGDDGFGLGIDALQLVDVLEDENGAAIGPQKPHAFFQGFEIAKRGALIEKKQGAMRRRRRHMARAKHRVHGQADHHAQEAGINGKKLFRHNQEEALR